MDVLVDTSVWSLMFRRRASARLSNHEARLIDELEQLIEEGRARILGVTKLELLTGIQSATYFKKLRERLRFFPNIDITPEVYELAADCANKCRRKGVTPGVVDILVCATAIKQGMLVFASDPDYEQMARHLPIRFHASRFNP